MTGYNVVLEYTEEAKGFEGVITWTSFASKEKFEEQRDQFDIQEIIAEGVSADEAVEYVRTTPLSAYVGSALEENVEDDGSINRFGLEMKLGQVVGVHLMKSRGDEDLLYGVEAGRRLMTMVGRIPELSRVKRDPEYRKLVQTSLADVVRAGNQEIKPDEAMESFAAVQEYLVRNP